MSIKNPVFHAIKSLHPFAEFGLTNDDYSTLVWHEEESVIQKPTEDEVLAEVVRMRSEYEYTEYQRLRAAEYPSFAEQFDTLYHGGYDAWKATIEAVKQKYPKPE